MSFKRALTVRGLHLNPREGFAEFSVDGELPCEVTLRAPSTSEQEAGHPSDSAMCDAVAEFVPNEKVRVALEALRDHRLPLESKDHESWGTWPYDYISETGELLDNHMAPSELLPGGLQNFMTETFRSLDVAAKTTVGIVRWRLGDTGRHQPFSVRGNFYSWDGATWHRAPMDMSVEVSSSAAHRINSEVQETVQGLLAGGNTEPLGHILWREAWGQRSDNPRSSLLIGMSALEVGIKNFVSQKVPNAGWLVEETPTPPVARMLTDYLPSLPDTGGGQFVAPEKATLEIIKKGTNLRNKVAHTGQANLKRSSLTEILIAVREVLWMLDSSTGFSWATQLKDSFSSDET